MDVSSISHYAKIVNQDTGEVVTLASADELVACVFGAATAAGEARFSAGGLADGRGAAAAKRPALSSVPYRGAGRPGDDWERKVRLITWPGGLEFQPVKTEKRLMPALLKLSAPAARAAAGGRGDVVGFSPRSRSRMRKALARTVVPPGALFTTLTLSDELVAQHIGADGLPDTVALSVLIKSAQDAVIRRAKRRWGADGVGLLWRMEVVARKSGRFTGALVPHLHWMVVTHPGSMRRFREWLWLAWGGVLSVRSRVDVSPVLSRQHASHYLAKYLAKDEDGAGALAVGRRWGQQGKLPEAALEVYEMTYAQAVEVKRLVVRWLAGEARKREAKGRRGGSLVRYARRMARGSPVWSAFVYGAGWCEDGAGLSSALARAAGLAAVGLVA